MYCTPWLPYTHKHPTQPAMVASPHCKSLQYNKELHREGIHNSAYQLPQRPGQGVRLGLAFGAGGQTHTLGHPLVNGPCNCSYGAGNRKIQCGVLWGAIRLSPMHYLTNRFPHDPHNHSAYPKNAGCGCFISGWPQEIPHPFANGGASINCGTHTSQGQTNTMDFVSGVEVNMWAMEIPTGRD